MKRILIVIVLVLVAASAGAAPADAPAALQAVVDAFHEANPSAPGVALAVIWPAAGIDSTFTAGWADSTGGMPLGADATFRIASNTKTYVAAALLRLVEGGFLGLDDPLARHLRPGRARVLADDGYDLEAITIAQVLSHTAGLFEHPADPRYEEAILENPHRTWTPDEQIALCAAWGDPVAAPGDTFSYSDTGYILLGGIIEDKTGAPLGPAVRALLDEEALGLHATWWEVMEPQPDLAGPRAHQRYGALDTYDWNPSLDLYGGGGIVASAGDLARFMRALLKGQVLHKSGTLEAMTGRGTPGYRLGLFHLTLAGHEAWGHTGFWNTFAFYVPDLDLAVGGAVTDHFAARGQGLAEEAVAAAAALQP